MSNYNYLMKFILIGNSGVGKSCMLFQFIEDKFKNGIEPTIGIEFGTKIMDIKEKIVRLQIWDSAGQENYRSITRSYYRNTICAFLVYDTSSRKSFEDIKIWLEEAKTYGNKSMYFVLIGNKCDLRESREVPLVDGEIFAKENQMIFFETSAKENVNVFKAFESVVECIVADIKKGKIDPYNESLGVKVGLNSIKQNFLDNKNLKKEKSDCC